MGSAGLVGGAATAIANANGTFSNRPHLAYFFYVGSVLLIFSAWALSLMSSEGAPHIVALAYGNAAKGTALHSHGYAVGHSGLILANHGDPGYEIGVYEPFVVFGIFHLCFENRINSLRKEDNAGQLNTWIDSRSLHMSYGGGDLFEIMRQHEIGTVHIPVLYKDIKNRWYKTVCTITRDVVHTHDGLLVTSRFRGRTFRPGT